nr:lytic transglycosylase domain-containing protein [candidate division Zixibacteria bacterium]
MFDQELARNMAGVSDRSLAGVLYRSLEEVLEKQAGTGPEDETVEKSLFPTPTYLPIKKETPDAAKSVKSSDEITSNSQNDDYREHVKTAAQKYKISAELIEAIIKRESGGNPGAVSEAGAKGLMQLTDTTAADMGVDDVFNPAQNIDGGSKYLRKMIDRFGNLELALGAYNAGPATVDKYGGVPPYPETRNYIKTVLAELSAKLPDK